MKCNNCGNEFTEGIFCPECGTKYVEEKSVVIEQTSVEVKKYEKEQVYDDASNNEVEAILKLGWSNEKEAINRTRNRIDVYKKALSMNYKSSGALGAYKQMRSDLINDYNILKKDDNSIILQIIIGIVFIGLAITYLFPMGIIGIIVGLFVIGGAFVAVFDLIKIKGLLKELDDILDVKVAKSVKRWNEGMELDNGDKQIKEPSKEVLKQYLESLFLGNEEFITLALKEARNGVLYIDCSFTNGEYWVGLGIDEGDNIRLLGKACKDSAEVEYIFKKFYEFGIVDKIEEYNPI